MGNPKIEPLAPDDMDSLLIISQNYWPEPIGTPYYVTGLAQWMAKKGTRVSVITGRPYYPEFKLKSGFENGQRDTEVVRGVSIQRLPTYIPKGGSAAKRIANELVYFCGVWAQIIRRKILPCRYVISFCPTVLSVFLGRLATLRGGRNVAVVYDIQSGLAAGLNMLRFDFFIRIFRWFEKTCLNRADHIIVLSEQMRLALRNIGVNRPITVIPIWVDEKAITPRTKPKSDGYTLLYSGNLGRKQGLIQLLDLAEILSRERPDIRLLIRGSGSQKSSLVSAIARRDLKNISIEPLLPFEKLNDGLSDGDIHLAPQSPHAADFAVPSKIYSIMAAGRPIIATAVEGTALWDMQEATQGAILCVTPNKPQELFHMVVRLLDDEALRREMGEKGRRYIESTAGIDIVLNQYLALLTEGVE